MGQGIKAENPSGERLVHREGLEEYLKRCTVHVEGSGRGTGFFAAPGRVVTCRHVLKQSRDDEVTVTWEGQRFRALSISPALSAGAEPSMPDLAVIAVECSQHPIVFLSPECKVDDKLYSYGFSDLSSNGEPFTAQLEGFSENPRLLKFKQGQVRPGFSGAPVLNRRTGAVCGIVSRTRDRGSDLGGRGIPVDSLLQMAPELADLQRTFHAQDNRWTGLQTARQRRTIAPHAARWRRWAAASSLLCAFAGSSWFLWPKPWHRIFHTTVLVLPFEPPLTLASERRTADEIGQTLARDLDRQAGFHPVPFEVSRLLASTQESPSETRLPSATLREVRRLTGADLVARGIFEVFRDRQPRKIIGCLQSAVDGQTILQFEKELARPDDLEPALEEMAAQTRRAAGPPKPFARVQRYSHDEEALRLYLEGTEHFQRYELKAAQAELEAAVARDGEFSIARWELSRLWQALGDDGRAQDEAKRALIQLGRTAEMEDERQVLMLRAYYLTTLGQWERAIHLYKSAWGQAREDAESVVRLAEVQNLAGMADQALATVRQARERQARGGLSMTAEIDATFDLQEATAHFWLGRADHQLEAAHRAVAKLVKLPQPRILLEALAKHRECDARIKLGWGWDGVCSEARDRFRASGDRIDAAKFDQLFAIWLAGQGGDDNKHRALGLDRQVLNVFREESFTRGTIDQMTNLSESLTDRGTKADVADAKDLCKEALQLARDRRSLNLSRVLATCAYFPAMDRDFARAKRMYAEALDIARRRKDLAAQAALQGNLAYMDHALGDRLTALGSYQTSLGLSRKIGDLGWDYGETLVRFARLLVDVRRESEARENLSLAWACYLTGKRRSEIPTILESIDSVLGPGSEPWRQLVARELSERSAKAKACPPRAGVGSTQTDNESEI